MKRMSDTTKYVVLHNLQNKVMFKSYVWLFILTTILTAMTFYPLVESQNTCIDRHSRVMFVKYFVFSDKSCEPRDDASNEKHTWNVLYQTRYPEIEMKDD